jgi:ankyrin repeat protein
VATAASPSPWEIPSWRGLAWSAWIGVAGLQFLFLGLHLLRLKRLCRAGIPWLERRQSLQLLVNERGIRRQVELLRHEGIAAPITWGAWHPLILVPADACTWSEDDLRRCLIHELEHVRRNDWIIQMLARIVAGLYWFHPLIWIAWRRLCLEAERACDDAVILGTESTDYAEQLVGLAQRMSKEHAQPALGMAHRSDLSARVSALLDTRQRRGRIGLPAAAGAIAAAALIVAAVAPLTAIAQSSGTPSSGSNSRRIPALDRALYEAAEAGDLEDIDSLLNAGANVNAVIRGDGSPLIGAARKGRLRAVVKLLDRGADPNIPVSGDGNPLIMAAAAGHLEVVSLLLDRGARIDEVVPTDENALIQASGKGRLDVVKLLVSRRANVNTRLWVETSGAEPRGEWRSPLTMARRGGHQAVVDFLVASGARE